MGLLPSAAAPGNHAAKSGEEVAVAGVWQQGALIFGSFGKQDSSPDGGSGGVAYRGTPLALPIFLPVVSDRR